MSADAPPFAVYPGGDTAHGDGSPGREFQELWFAVASRPWASLVLVPADAGGSAARIATSLAAVGTRLGETSVTAIVANSMDYASARALTELQPRVRKDQPWDGAIVVAARDISVGNGTGGAPETGPVREAQPLPPTGRAVIAIQPVVAEPLGVSVARAADVVVLCIEMGLTRVESARRTIELIGADHVLGAFLVR